MVEHIGTVMAKLAASLAVHEPMPQEMFHDVRGCERPIRTPEAERQIAERLSPGLMNFIPWCECGPLEQAAVAAHVAAAHLPNEHAPKTFDNFDQERLGLWTAVDAAKKFMAYEGPRILTLSGDTGVGKSHLAEAIARSFLASGMSVRYEFVPELVLSLQAASNPRNLTQVEDILAPAKDAGLLWLDDFGEEKPSDFTALHLTNLVEDRIRRNALMVVTTNKSLQNMREDFKPNPGEPGLYFRLGSRLFDVHTGTVRVVTIEAKDYRVEGS